MGIISQRTCPYTSQQNGVVGRNSFHLLDVVRALLLASSVPSTFRVEPIPAAFYLINQPTCPKLQHHSPYSRLYGKYRPYAHLRTFSCFLFFIYLYLDIINSVLSLLTVNSWVYSSSKGIFLLWSLCSLNSCFPQCYFS